MTMQPLPVGGDPKPKSISAKISAWLHAAAGIGYLFFWR
jgi:hypothetical protein